MRGTSATRRVARIAARQEGNITFAQLRDAGLEEWEIEARIACGWLVRRHARLYAVGHVPLTATSRYRAAVLALGDQAALSHRAAGSYWGMVRGAVPVEVTVPTSNGRRRRDGIIVHRAPLPAGHVITEEGLRVTSVLRTTLDLSAVLPIRPLGWAFEEAQVRHHLDPVLLGAEVLSRRGHRGNAKLGLLLKDAVDPGAVLSILELRFLRLCAAHAIPRPLVNEKLGPWTPDFYWPEHQLVVETDGVDFHRTAAARRRDALKDAYMESLGLTVTRLRWTDVTLAPAATAARIQTELAR
jgi:hypothetical protein